MDNDFVGDGYDGYDDGHDGDTDYGYDDGMMIILMMVMMVVLMLLFNQNKMKELDLKEKSSKSLLANVLDMDDDYRPSSTLPQVSPPPPLPAPCFQTDYCGSQGQQRLANVTTFTVCTVPKLNTM